MEAKPITVKIPVDMLQRLDSLAQLLGQSRNALVKEGVAELLAKRGVSVHEKMADHCGCVSGPADASVSEAYKERFK